jgi:hypothetical protein
VSQLTDICPFEEQECSVSNLEKSTLLERRVFKKVSKDKVMLHKIREIMSTEIADNIKKGWEEVTD